MCADVISDCLLWAMRKAISLPLCQRGHKGLTQLLTDGIVFCFHHFKEQTHAKNNNQTTLQMTRALSSHPYRGIITICVCSKDEFSMQRERAYTK
jgi:hypothetical protein